MRKLALIIAATAALLIPALAPAAVYGGDEGGSVPWLGDCNWGNYGEWGYWIDGAGGGHAARCLDTQYLDPWLYDHGVETDWFGVY